MPSGRLTLKFEGGSYHRQLRRKFSDGAQQRIENRIDAILESFAAFSAAEKAWRIEQERRRLQAIEDEKQRRENERWRTLSHKRHDFLMLQI